MKYEIKIPKPCHEDWNKMTPTEKGVFCTSCKKEVIDFTKMTEQQLINEIEGNNNLCGRFKKKQLNKEIGEGDSVAISKVAASIALVAMLGSTDSLYAQGKVYGIEKVQLEKKIIISKKKVEKDTITIRGNIRDKGGSLPGVSIFLKETAKGVETDFEGNFSLTFIGQITKKDTLVVSYLGYETIEIDVKSIKRPLKIIMEERGEMLGEVTLGVVIVEKKPNIFQRIGNLFRRKDKNTVKKND
ncbi:MAG: carboxypeptidase-like regulatory domain-containing protein [Flavobacteriaceae bacterium]|nr:carboxypeptidase-like regulatory domain-containing protein [Flavobacteriaceae bacterium]